MSKCHPRKDTLTTAAALEHIECGCDNDLDWYLADVALEAELGPTATYFDDPSEGWIAVSRVHGR